MRPAISKSLVLLVLLLVCPVMSAHGQSVSIANPSLPDGIVVVPYYQQLFATGGTGPYTWTIAAGSLPAGMSLDAGSGILSGTPTVAGDYAFAVQAVDQGQVAGLKTLALKIVPGYGDLVAVDAGTNAVYRVALDGAKTSIGTVPGSPEDVAVDPNTGDVYAVTFSNGVWRVSASGTVEQLTTLSGVAVAVDGYGNIYVGNNSLDVVYKVNSSGQQVDAAGAPTTSPLVALPSSATELEDIRMIFDRDGYLLVASDALGLQQIQRVSPGGEVTNLFTAGSAPFTRASGMVFANDGSGALVVADFSQKLLIKIANVGTPGMAASTLIALPNLPYSITGLAGHPTNPGEYYVLLNGIENGSSLHRVELGTGSVTHLADFSYGTGLAWSRFTQAPYLAIAPATVPDGTVGVNYSQQFSATAAPGPVTWSNSGTLPPGLTLDSSSGVLWGTPTQAGDYRFILVATYGGQSAHQALTLKIAPGFGGLIVSDSLGVYRVGLDGSTTRIDATPPITWAYAVAADADGNGYAAQSGVWKFPPLGGQTQVSTVGGLALAVDRYGNMYVGRNDTDVVYKLNSSGQIVDAAGNPTTDPFVLLPSSPDELEDIKMIFDRDGYLLVASDALGLQQIQRVSPSGEVTNLFTAGQTPFEGVGGIAFANDGSGALVVADWRQNSLIEISNLGTPSMVASALISSSSLSGAMTGMVAHPTSPGEYLVVINDAAHAGANSTLTRVAPATGSVTTVAGFTYALDVAALGFSQPSASATLTLGNLAQTYDGTPRAVSVDTVPAGVPVAVTYIGTGGTVYGPSTAPPTNAGTYQVDAAAQGMYQGLATGTLTISPRLLTITAENLTKTYGNALALMGTEFVAAGLVSPDTVTSVTLTSDGLPATAPPGTYPIVPSAALGTGLANYNITYVAGTLTVKPHLIIVADNKSMGAGSVVPLLTASYFGLANGDTPATVGGGLQLSTTASSSSPAGTYDITFASVPDLPDYTVTTVPGKLTVNPDLLAFNNNYFVTGDFAVGWVSLRGQGDPTGFATGAISIPNVGLPGAANTVPAGADIVAAYLYWQSVEWSGLAPAARGLFRDYPITGLQLGNDIPFAPDPAPAPVAGGGSTVVRMYRANVLPYLPLDADGRRLPAGPHTVTLPEGGAALPFNSGASLVVVYRVLSKDFPLKAVVLYDGAWVNPDGLQLTVRGFYDATAGATTRLFNMASTASAFVPNLMTSSSLGGSSYSENSPAAEGTAGGMQVFSVAVHDSDDDGLLDAWETAQGYNEITDGSWVDLAGAVNGQKDMFVQLDYMCSAVNPDGTCAPANSRLPQPDPVSGQDPLVMVQEAFDAIGIKLHYVMGYAIQEETCTDGPDGLCQFPNEPGVVGWKTGLEVLKAWARDPAGCVSGIADSCKPRFERGQKDSYHYVLFGDSLAVSAWNTRARTLDSIVVSGGTATITTPPRAPLNGSTCPSRVTVSGALGAPALNGVYDVSGCQGSNTVITISAPGVGDWTYSKPASAADEREPMLAVISGDISSISGFSDLGGADTAVTLYKWATNPTQDMSKKANVQAGTLMHELGHTIGLAHGGAYQDTVGSYALTFGSNCKPNYQSIMNYLFQIDLLPGNVLAFSGQALDTMNESAGSVTWTGTPAIPQTMWYVPWSSSASGSPATRHCDGTPILDNAQMVRQEQTVASMTWTPGRDVNFDGQLNIDMRGYDDLPNIDLRQVGATGGEYVAMAELLGFGTGGTLALGSGGTIALGSGGTLTMGSGGTLALGSGGTFTMGSGGTLTFGSGGTITFSGEATLTLGSNGSVVFGSGGGSITISGGTLALGSGGTFAMGSGGLLTMGSGGTLVLGGGGGTVTFGSGGGSVAFPDGGGAATFGSGETAGLGSGGLLTMGSGGTLALGSGGTLALGSGGTFTMGSGGTLMMGSGGTFAFGSGGLLTMGSGGLLTMGSGGTFTMGSGGTFTMGSGGTFALGSGGTFALGSGGTFTMGSGGTIALGSGGTFALGSGGTLALGSGGTLALGSGGTIALGSGGTFALGSGGVIEEMTYEVANSVVRPPSGVTATPVLGGAVQVSWQPPVFGVVSLYTVYYSAGTNPPVQVGTVSGDTLTFTVANPVAGASYFVTTTVAADPVSQTPERSSPASWRIQGFYSPVSMPPVWNVVKGGSTVPLKFNIYAGAVEQTALSAVSGGSVALHSVACEAAVTSQLTTTADTTAGTSLRYDGTQFVQNWKTPKQAGLCYAARVTAADGTSITAYFKTK